MKELMNLEQLEAATDRLAKYKQPLLGLAELALVLGVSKQRLANWRSRKPEQMPRVDVELAMSPIWHSMTIWNWLAACKLKLAELADG